MTTSPAPKLMPEESGVATVKNLELFLLGLRYRDGRLIELEGNKPVVLDDPARAWVVYSGTAHVFGVPIENGEPADLRTFVFSATPGQLLMGVGDVHAGVTGMGLIASGMPGTRLIELPLAKIQAYAAELEYSHLITLMTDDWIRNLSIGINADVLPKDYVLVETGQSMPLDGGQIVMARRETAWLSCASGKLNYLGRNELPWAADAMLPLTMGHWATAVGSSPHETQISAVSTYEVLTSPIPLGQRLGAFHTLILSAAQIKRDHDAVAETTRLHAKQQAEQQTMHNAMRDLVAPLHKPNGQVSTHQSAFAGTGLFEACKMIGEYLQIGIRPVKRATAQMSMGYMLKVIAQSSHVQLREVALRGSWWTQDNGPFLAFLLDDEEKPVALLPKTESCYELASPHTHTVTTVTSEVAATLSPIAYTFYRPFLQKMLRPFDVLRFGFHKSSRDVRAILLVSLIITLIGLLAPVATGIAFNQFIPAGDTQSLIAVGAALVVIAVICSALQIARGIAMVRVQSRFDATVQAALWDRLLRLPTEFFRRFAAGDLGARAMGISELRRTLSGHTISTLINGMFSVANLVLLFVYSPTLALVALALAIFAFGVTLFVSVLTVRSQRVLQHMNVKLSGTILQIITGVTKFRVAGAEHFAFGLWAADFGQLKQRYYKSRRTSNVLTIFNSAFPLIATLSVFGMLAISGRAALPVGDFLAFNLAFTQFMSAWMQVGSVAVIALGVISTFEQIQPILSAQPEADETKVDPGDLSGRVEVSHVFFRYNEKTQHILKDVSLQVQPGEFVALVGASGSGKSTLLRMLLGMATPELGGVYFDNQDLKELNAPEVRRQIGVVLQNAAVMPGDLYTNIVGSWPNLTLDDAWNAARAAGLAEDIEKMPMGMHTVVSERGGNLSGGQRQRLLIARALVNRPRIILFDEATSALDNQTQDIVSRSLESLKATRIVIAHRLSTIINADRIFVFEAGSIVQVGTYGELVNQPGLFAELARRQVV